MFNHRMEKPPYDLKGRWYQIFLESNGTDVTITHSDIECEFEGMGIKMPENFHILDCIHDINSIPHSATITMAQDLFGYPDGRQGVYKPVASAFDWAYVYVFGYYA